MPEKKYVSITGGTHTWSPSNDQVDSIIQVLRKRNVKTLDTARRYAVGGSETTIGDRGLPKEFAIDTKAHTHVNPGGGRLIEVFAAESLKALQTDKIRVYLLHGPDDTVPFGEQMEALQRLYLEGKFERLGLSNFSKDQVLEIYNYAKSKGYVLPSVYQSNYSLATRRLETELFPTLRELGMSFQAYSPMAAGFLAKTPEYIQKGLGSWNPNESYGKLLHLMFGKPSYMQMLAGFGKLSEDSGISRAGLAYRWVRHHSALDANLGDEMIIGASNAQQIEHTLDQLDAGELEPWVVKRIDELWEIVKADAPLGNNESAWQAFGPAV